MTLRFDSSILLSACLVFAANVLASNVTENTTTGNTVGWKEGPNIRGTLSLIWSCIATIFACTWTVLHLNVPSRNDSPVQRTGRKVKWMAINILFPELLFSKAVCDLRQALDELRDFGDRIQDINRLTKWTVTHDTGMWLEPSRRAREWSWDVEYPWLASTLYRLFLLRRPLSRSIEHSTTPTDGQDDNSQFRGDFQPIMPDLITKTDSPRYRSSIHEMDMAEIIRTVSPETRREIELSPIPAENVPEKPITSPSRTTQKWTIVHSYYAQMGGLLHPECYGNKAYSTLTATRLTSRYNWFNDNHPLKFLVLSENDIQNTSKADWLLKGIAVFQIIWLVVNVVVRGITGLFVTQLEIATVAFAIMAILTYLASWWKPKDVSESTLLQHHCPGAWRSAPQIQQLSLWLWSPAQAADHQQRKRKIDRVPNDSVWMEADTPLITVLLAISSMLFGGLHCIAWNFEFPSRTELICWRVACLASAFLPVITLGISTLLSYLSIKYVEVQRVTQLTKELENLPRLSVEQWKLILDPTFVLFGAEALVVFIRSMPKRSADWEQEPAQEADEGMMHDTIGFHCGNFMIRLRSFRESWLNAIAKGEPRPAHLGQEWFQHCEWLKETWEQRKPFQDFWRAYEDFININVEGLAYVDRFMKAYDQAKSKVEKTERAARKASALLSIFSVILYTSVRLLTIALIFTSLRATPANVYQITPWVSFLPKIS